MIQRFKTYLTEQELLTEKLLLINNGAKYGQIVFLAGGAGSGKGFAGSNFMNSQDFKVRDVDEMKRLFLKIDKEKGKYPEISGLNLKNPNDVFKLHMFVEKGGFADSSLNNAISQMKNKNTLPNIIFDVTMKNIKKYYELSELMVAAGYDTKNIHLVWVLTDYSVAIKANRERDRVVPEDILLQTHVGAHDTMWDVVGKGNMPRGLDGGIYVILNNRENTVFYSDENGNPIKTSGRGAGSAMGPGTDEKGRKGKGLGSGNLVIKDFKYLVYKEPGKAPNDNAKIKMQLYQWVLNNVPVTAGKGIWS
jgi:dephospho-CoA kinase